MLNFLNKWIKKKEVPVSKIDEVVHRYRTIEFDNLSKVFSSDKNINTLRVYKHTIVEYISLLKLLTFAFKNEQQLYIAQVTGTEKIVYLADFFVDSNFNYVKPVNAMTEFSELAADFLQQYQVCELNLDPSFIIQSNLRLTKGVASNLIQLIDQIRYEP